MVTISSRWRLPQSFLVGLFILVLSTGPAQAEVSQSNPTVDSLFNAALRLYQAEQFEEAAVRFAQLAEQFPRDARAGYCAFMQGKARYYSGDLQGSKEVFDSLIKSRPSSYYAPACHFFRGRIRVRDQAYEQAFAEFVTALNQTDDADQRQVYRESLLALAGQRLSPEFLRLHGNDLHDYRSAMELAATTTEEFAERREFVQARQVLRDFLAVNPQARSEERLSQLQRRLETYFSGTARIALLAPLSGEWAQFGRGMANAFELAIAEYADRLRVGLESDVYDTYGNAVTATLRAKEAEEKPLSAMVGPLSSSEAAGMAAYADLHRIPMICPTASENGLTSISRTLYQLSPSSERYGSALAELAVEIGLDSVAVLAPDDNYGHQIVDGFRQTVADSGVTVFYQKFYPRGLPDYERFLLDLKSLLLPDSFKTQVLVDEYGDTLTVENFPIGVPALLLPAYSAELKLLLPQLRFYKMKTLILGTESYGEDEVVKMPESADNPIFFSSRSTFLPEDTLWLKFSLNYRRKYGAAPDRVAAATYDATGMVLRCMEADMFVAEDIQGCLTLKDRLAGASGRIRFNAQHENIYVPIFLLSERRILRVE